MSVKSVLTDLGGVLIHYSIDLAIAAWARLAHVDAAVVAESVMMDEAWEAFEVGRLTEPEFCSHLRRQSGLDLTDDELIEGWNSIYIGVNAPVERLLRDVGSRGIRVVAVTNTNVTHQRAWQERFAASLRFLDAVYSSWQVGARKPDPAFFEDVLESEQASPHEALFIDDVERYVEVAEGLGIDGILYTGADGLRDAFAARGLLTTQSTP